VLPFLAKQEDGHAMQRAGVVGFLLFKSCQGTNRYKPTTPSFLEFLAQGPRTAGVCLLVQEIRVMSKKKTLRCQIDSPYLNDITDAHS
jgi:hypothetical protein